MDGLFGASNYKYYNFTEDGIMMDGLQEPEEFALRSEILTLFLSIREINVWFSGETMNRNNPPALDEIKEKKNELETKYNRLLLLTGNPAPQSQTTEQWVYYVCEEIDRYYEGFANKYYFYVMPVALGKTQDAFIQSMKDDQFINPPQISGNDLLNIIISGFSKFPNPNDILDRIDKSYDKTKKCLELQWQGIVKGGNAGVSIDRGYYWQLPTFHPLQYKEDVTVSDLYNAIIQELDTEYMEMKEMMKMLVNPSQQQKMEQQRSDILDEIGKYFDCCYQTIYSTHDSIITSGNDNIVIQRYPSRVPQPVLDSETLFKKIAVYSRSNDCSIEKKYITKQYDKLKRSLEQYWKRIVNDGKDTMPINNEDNAALLDCLFIEKESPILYDVHNARIQRLDAEYNNIIAVFDNNNQEQPTSESRQKAKREPRQRKFIDALKHKDKEALMVHLHSILDGESSGVEVAKVLESLVDVGHLQKNTGIISAAIRDFNLQCSNQAITKYFSRASSGGAFEDKVKQPIKAQFS